MEVGWALDGRGENFRRDTTTQRDGPRQLCVEEWLFSLANRQTLAPTIPGGPDNPPPWCRVCLADAATAAAMSGLGETCQNAAGARSIPP